MSIQSISRLSPFFSVPSKLQKKTVLPPSKESCPSPPKLQRSGNQGSLPDLLTQEALERLFPDKMTFEGYKA
jgi:hypothetical protein